MTQDNNDLDSMTGADNVGGKAMVLNIVQLNGDAEIKEQPDGSFKPKGGFYRKMLMIGKRADERPESENLGETVHVVMLKIRRRLEQRSKTGQVVLRTTEHNTKKDVVELYGEDNKFLASGRAEDLREKYDGLRTVQVIYSLLLSPSGTKEPELVKLIVKGSSLGSEAKEKSGLPSFYDYVSSYGLNEESGEKEHLREHITELGFVKEEGVKTYFTMTFKKGAKLDAALQEVANNTLRDVHAKKLDEDKAVQTRVANASSNAASARTPDGGGETVIQVDEEEDETINPEDIPL